MSRRLHHSPLRASPERRQFAVVSPAERRRAEHQKQRETTAQRIADKLERLQAQRPHMLSFVEHVIDGILHPCTCQPPGGAR